MDVAKFDVEKSMADVYLYTRPVTLNGSSASSNLEGISFPPGLPSGLKHWTLVIKFSDKTLYVEASEKDKLLVPEISYEDKYRNWTDRKKIGSKRLSPALVCKIAMANRLNFAAYDALLKNCQDWVKEMIVRLGLRKEECPFSADTLLFGGGAAIGLTALGMLLSE